MNRRTRLPLDGKPHLRKAGGDLPTVGLVIPYTFVTCIFVHLSNHEIVSLKVCNHGVFERDHFVVEGQLHVVAKLGQIS